MARKLEVYPDEVGEYRWRLIGGNGEGVIPPEGHTTPHDAERAMRQAAFLLAEALTTYAPETGRTEVPRATD
jgi:uncharacterized protein YegP (UPF0339 family)